MLEASQRALEHRDFAYFATKLPVREHWRILSAAARDTLYLDIETTGLSRQLHDLTVVGALYRNSFYQWVWPDALDGLAQLLSEAALVVTFNGSRFDLPFLWHHVPALPAPRLHIDLRYIAARAGLAGGQKVVETALGLARADDARGISGADAIALWCRALYGDRRAYASLLAYNREDVLMLRALSEQLTDLISSRLLYRERPSGRPSPTRDKSSSRRFRLVHGHRPPRLKIIRSAWDERRATIASLEPVLRGRVGRMPVIIGIDLRGKPHNPTGWARCIGTNAETTILYEDDEIFERTLAASPDLVSIDAPLSLPRGRLSVSDDDPNRERYGIVREAERILWSRGIRVYPSLIRHMQGLTSRGISLAERLRARGIEVIESYPGAAQDVLGIPRKGTDESLLAQGLVEFGFDLSPGLSHDELDAVTSALVGYFYLADRYEGVGAEDENFLIIPRANTVRWSEGPRNKGT
jgi:uncharacterized protein YprB with RNaseH-like and TPR domain/predicted nuclease with RNAse H fold